MKPIYNLQWLTDKFDSGEALKFLFFWGHSNKQNSETGPACFSQWFELPFIVDNVMYKTAEHWMMANKALLFEDIDTYEKIIKANTPGEAKDLGRRVIGFDDQIWNVNRMKIVISGNIHKFNQNTNYLTFLINTNSRILVEASPIDTIWGIGLAKDAEHIDNPYFWRGENLLGFALMAVRDFFSTYGQFSSLENVVLPPWKIYPNIHPIDGFWRMGKGEEFIIKFSNYYSELSERDKAIFELCYLAPSDWTGFYHDLVS